MKKIIGLLNGVKSEQKMMVIYFALSILGSGLNYIFQIVLGNMLEIEEFGVYNSLNSIASNITIVFSPLTVIACKMTVTNKDNLRKNTAVYKQIFLISFFFMVAILLVGTAFFMQGNECMGISSYLIWLCFLVMIGICGQYTILYGVIQGLENFVFYGMLGAILILVRLILSIVLISGGYGIDGVIVAILVSNIVILIMAWKHISMHIEKFGKKSQSTCLQIREIVELYGITFLAQLLLSFYINGGEIIFMNAQYDTRQVGLYSSAATLGKVSLYVISIISVVLFPKVASKSEQGKETKSLLLKTVLVSLILAIGYAAFLGTIGKFLIIFLFGQEYQNALEYIPSVIFFVIPLCILPIIHNYVLGIGKAVGYTIYVGIVTIVLLGICYFCVSEIYYIPIILGIGLWTIIIITMIYIWLKKQDEVET